MNEKIKKVKQVCKCENCGNEAEMMITCTLHDADSHDTETVSKPAPDQDAAKNRVKGTATCSHCGNEADLWVDL